MGITERNAVILYAYTLSLLEGGNLKTNQSMLLVAPLHYSDLLRWVSAEWLTQWANDPENAPFKREALLCKNHGKLDPNKVSGMASRP